MCINFPFAVGGCQLVRSRSGFFDELLQIVGKLVSDLSTSFKVGPECFIKKLYSYFDDLKDLFAGRGDKNSGDVSYDCGVKMSLLSLIFPLFTVVFEGFQQCLERIFK